VFRTASTQGHEDVQLIDVILEVRRRRGTKGAGRGRMGRWLLTLAVVATLLGSTASASGEEVDSMRVEVRGPGIDEAVAAELYLPLTNRAQQRFVQAVWGERRRLEPPFADSLGHAYRVTVRVRTMLVSEAAITLKATLYPFAGGGPWLHADPESWDKEGSFPLRGGWSQLPAGSLAWLEREGLPSRPPTGTWTLTAIATVALILVLVLMSGDWRSQRAEQLDGAAGG
jgi:hypothetical protein